MKQRALLIGINDYHLLGELKYARQDAEAVADALCQYCGFTNQDITLMSCQAEGATLGLSSYIEHALTNLTDCRDLDLLVFGFWGHGFAPQPGQRYLCGLDAAEHDLLRTAVSFDVVKAKLAQVQAENTLLLLDCCQNRPAGRSASAEPMTHGEEAALAGLARDIQAAQRKQHRSSIPTVAILNACREGQKAYEWDSRGHGIFTAHLLDAFQEGFESIAPLAVCITDRVAKTSRDIHHQQQTPYVTIEGRGDIPIILKTPRISEHKESQPATVELLDQLRQDIQFDINECLRAMRLGSGSIAYLKKAYKSRLSDWRQAAELNWPEAQWLLGRCYHERLGVERDDVQALMLYKRAADQGLATAQCSLARCYANGAGVLEDKAEAVRWYRKAVDQGFAIAQYHLALCYARGEGLAEDKAEAVKWYREAAEQGFGSAQYNLAWCYANGAGVPEDKAEAVRWYRKAAEQGLAEAQASLALCYMCGTGIPEDRAEAVIWCYKAAEQGWPGSQELLHILQGK